MVTSEEHIQNALKKCEEMLRNPTAQVHFSCGMTETTPPGGEYRTFMPNKERRLTIVVDPDPNSVRD